MKVSLNGQVYDYDGSRAPMSEALAIEKAYGRRYAEWQSELQAGSAEAMAVLAWVIWRRDGRDIELRQILAGEVDFDLHEMLLSIAESAAQDEAADPTTPGGESAPGGTPTTGSATPPLSLSGSVSAPGKSGSSKSKSSKP